MFKTLQFYKKVLAYLRPFRMALLISFIFSLVPAALASSNQYFLGKITDALIAQNGEQVRLFLILMISILLLDEATSSLDSETESIVNKAIWEMLGDKTGAVIAHRLSTIIDADRIVVMDHGKIVGIGNHKELLKTTPYYKRLVDAQNVNL